MSNLSIRDIYRNQLQREADPGGLAHYQRQLASGRTIEDIRKEIASSPEAKSRSVGAYASGGGGGTSAPAQPKEVKYKSILGGMGREAVPMQGLPSGGRGNARLYSALRAAANQRRDLFSGSGKSNLGMLGIREGYSFTGGPGKTLVDTISFQGSGAYGGGTLNIYKDPAKEEEPVNTGGGEGTTGGVAGQTTTGSKQTETVQTGPDYGKQIADAMAAADARMAELMNQFKIQQDAFEERQRLAAEAQRQQMITMQRRDRAAGRAPSLQISGAGETPRTAGTQGFRRRKDQFRITPFQGIGGILGVAGQVAQGAANQMVNI